MPELYPIKDKMSNRMVGQLRVWIDICLTTGNTVVNVDQIMGGIMGSGTPVA
jgi:hypothetical protein